MGPSLLFLPRRSSCKRWGPCTSALILVPTSRPTFQSLIHELRHHYMTRALTLLTVLEEDRAVAFPSIPHVKSVQRFSSDKIGTLNFASATTLLNPFYCTDMSTTLRTRLWHVHNSMAQTSFLRSLNNAASATHSSPPVSNRANFKCATATCSNTSRKRRIDWHIWSSSAEVLAAGHRCPYSTDSGTSIMYHGA